MLPKIDVANFTGRLDELAILESQLLGNGSDKTCSIVGLSGGGGMGKSALAFHFATLHRDKFPDGVIGLPVDGKATHEVARDFARRCGKAVDEDDDRSAATIMQEVFAHRRMLLIFDNADQSALKELRPGGDRCALIVTTRDRQIPNSFGITNDGIIDLPPMCQEDARDLLRRILGIDRVNAELESADQIIEITGGLPLALQITGSALRGRQRSLASYVESLKDEKTRVQRLQIRGDEDLNVTASLNLSLALLDESEINLFACMSACAKDGFSLKTAMVAGGLEDEWEARDLLDRLYQLSLLNEVSADRYVFHSLVRIYAQEQARHRRVWEDASRRHAEYFINLVQSNDVKKSEIAAHLIEDFDDVLQAAQWLRGNANSDELRILAYQFALDLRPFFLKYNYPKRAVELMSAFQEWADSLNDWNASVKFKIQQAKYLALEGDLLSAEVTLHSCQNSIDKIIDTSQQKAFQAKHLSGLGGILKRQRRFEEAILVFQKQVEIEEEINNQISLLIVLSRLGNLLNQEGRIKEAIDVFQHRIKVAETLNDQQSLSISLNCLGILFQQEGRIKDSIILFERQVLIAENLKDQKQLAIGLNCLGKLFQEQGKIEEAITNFERQILISENLKDQKQLAIGLNCLGLLLKNQERLEEATTVFKRQILISEDSNDLKQLMTGLLYLAGIFREQRRIDEAIKFFERILEIEENIRLGRRVVTTLTNLGLLLRQQHRFQESIDRLRRAIEVNMTLDSLSCQTRLLIALAETLHEYGCLLLKSTSTRDKSESILYESYEIYEQINDLFQMGIVLHSLGRLMKVMNRLEDAEKMLQESRNIFESLKENRQLTMVLNTTGGVLQRQNKLKSAELVLRESYDLAFKEKDTLSQAIISNSLGKIFAQQEGEENFSLARMYFINSLKLGRIINDINHLVKAHTSWGKVLIKYGRLEEALVELNKAFDLEEELVKLDGLQIVIISLTDVLTRLGRHSEVIEYFDRAIVVTNNNPALIEQREAFVRSMSSSKKPVLRKK